MDNFEEKYEEYFTKIERKEKRSFLKLIVFTILLISIAVFFIYKTVETIKSKNTTIEQKNSEITLRDSVFNEVSKDVLITFKGLNPSTLDSTTKENIKRTKNNLDTLPKILFKGGPTVVRYYKRKDDDPSISSIVEQMGFYLNIRPVKFDDGKTSVNIIWYGDSVKTEELQMLTFQLLNTKNQFKEIRKFKFHDVNHWKNKAIEIGFDPKCDTLPAITEPDLKLKLQQSYSSKEDIKME